MKQHLAAASLALATSTFSLAAQSSPVWQPLWADQEAPGAPRLPEGSEKVKNQRLYTDVEVPQFAFTPASGEPSGHCVIILPGGGYEFISFLNEGTEMASLLAEQGIASLIIKYRVSGKDEAGFQFPVPLLDARRAIRTARARAKEWQVDPKKIGVLGFSAGGHLAACTATMFDRKFEDEAGDQIDQKSPRPDFQTLVYPVISMGQPWVHPGSQRRLAGPSPDIQTLLKMNPTESITERTPPLFLIHASDDRPVPLRNSTEYLGICAQNQVPVTAFIVPKSGHAFGTRGKESTTGWTDDLILWIQNQ